MKRKDGPRLTPDRVHAIRHSGLPLRDIARKYGKSIKTIWNIQHNRTWKNVK